MRKFKLKLGCEIIEWKTIIVSAKTSDAAVDLAENKLAKEHGGEWECTECEEIKEDAE